MKVTEYTKTGTYAPSSWVGSTKSNKGIYIRFRHNRLKVIVGDPPLETEESSNIVLDINIEDKNKLDTREMVNILNNNDIEIGLEDCVSMTTDNIDNVKNDMDSHLNDM